MFLYKRRVTKESNGNGDGNLLVIIIKKRYDLVFLSIIMHLILFDMRTHLCTYFIVGVE